MRLFVFASALALATGYQADIRSQVDAWLGAEEDPKVQAAIQLRCESGPANLHLACARELEHEFESGAREPEAIVRRHCTRFSNEWAVEAERPLPICTELYGGWIEG
jgi:hypothetical protein